MRSRQSPISPWGVPAPVETTEILTRLATSFADRMYPKVEFGVDLGSTRLGFEAMKYGRLPSSKASQEGPYAMRLGADGALRPTLHGPALFDLIQGVRSGLPDDTLLRLYASAVEEMP